MTKLLLKLFVKNYNNTNDNKVRENYGTLSSIVCIICNVLLSVSKILVGSLLGIISVTADGLNNLTDCGSNIVSAVSFRLSNKPADKEHPYGHERLEYICSMIVAFLILTVGIQLAIESFNKILSPQELTFSWVSIAVLAASILVKLWMYIFNMRLSKAIDSQMLKATATDSISDVFSTVGVLVAVVVSTTTGVNIDGYMGCVVAIIIAIAAIKILLSTMNELLGKAPSPQLIKSIKDRVMSFAGVCGFHDLDVHSYGHNKIYASIHIEVDAKVDILASHDLADRIEKDFAINTGIVLVVHLDPIVLDNPILNKYREDVVAIVNQIDSQFDVHDFRMVEGVTHNNLIFDIAVPFDCNVKEDDIINMIQQKVNLLYDNVYVVANIEKQLVTK